MASGFERLVNKRKPPRGYKREDDPGWVNPRIIPGFGQWKNQTSPRPYRGGNPEGIRPPTTAGTRNSRRPDSRPTFRTPGAASLKRRKRIYS